MKSLLDAAGERAARLGARGNRRRRAHRARAGGAGSRRRSWPRSPRGPAPRATSSAPARRAPASRRCCGRCCARSATRRSTSPSPPAACSRRASREYCGLRVTQAKFLPLLAPVLRGESRFIRPFRDADRVESRRPACAQGPAFGWIATPVRGAKDEGDRRAGHRRARRQRAVGDPRRRAPGRDRRPVRLRRERQAAHAEPLRRDGALFAMPGVRPAAAAGEALEPYASARGARVVGAWRWLEDLGLGVAHRDRGGRGLRAAALPAHRLRRRVRRAGAGGRARRSGRASRCCACAASWAASASSAPTAWSAPSAKAAWPTSTSRATTCSSAPARSSCSSPRAPPTRWSRASSAKCSSPARCRIRTWSRSTTTGAAPRGSSTTRWNTSRASTWAN